MTNTYNAVITAIYKPTVNAIQYTGDINTIIEFIGKNRISSYECRMNTDTEEHSLGIQMRKGGGWKLTIGDYMIKHTYETGEVRFEVMDHLDFDVNFEQAVCDTCDTTESAADTTPKTGCVSPESGGAAMRSVLKAMEAAKVTSAPREVKPEQVGRVDYSENYYYIDSFGAICCTSDLDTYMDINRYESGNYFRTEKEAIQSRDERLLQSKYRQWCKRHDPTVKLDINWFANRFREITYEKDIKGNNGAINLLCILFSDNAKAVRFYTEHKDLIHAVIGNGDVLGIN